MEKHCIDTVGIISPEMPWCHGNMNHARLLLMPDKFPLATCLLRISHWKCPRICPHISYGLFSCYGDSPKFRAPCLLPQQGVEALQRKHPMRYTIEPCIADFRFRTPKLPTSLICTYKKSFQNPLTHIKSFRESQAAAVISSGSNRILRT